MNPNLNGKQFHIPEPGDVGFRVEGQQLLLNGEAVRAPTKVVREGGESAFAHVFIPTENGMMLHTLATERGDLSKQSPMPGATMTSVYNMRTKLGVHSDEWHPTKRYGPTTHEYAHMAITTPNEFTQAYQKVSKLPHTAGDVTPRQMPNPADPRGPWGGSVGPG